MEVGSRGGEEGGARRAAGDAPFGGWVLGGVQEQEEVLQPRVAGSGCRTGAVCVRLRERLSCFLDGSACPGSEDLCRAGEGQARSVVHWSPWRVLVEDGGGRKVARNGGGEM